MEVKAIVVVSVGPLETIEAPLALRRAITTGTILLATIEAQSHTIASASSSEESSSAPSADSDG